MGKLAVKKYFSFLILIITVLMMIFTFVGLYGGNVNPAGNTARSLLVYALPLLIVGDAILLIYWLILRRWHWALMPLITLLCCIPYVGTLYQPFGPDEAAEKQNGLRIASYNVALFAREASGFMAQDILSQMKKQKVDILCFQEYSDHCGDKKNSDSYKEYFPYMAMGAHDMVIYSRYPIVKSKNIPFEMTNNSAMWAEIKVNEEVIRVYNAHLETTGINSTLHRAAKYQRSTGLDIENNALMNAIYGSYTIGMMARAGQANILAISTMCPTPTSTTRCSATRSTVSRSVARASCTPSAAAARRCASTTSSTIRSTRELTIIRATSPIPTTSRSS